MSNNETVEEWRAVVGYEGSYEVSNCGNVRSTDHRVRLVAHGIETTRLSPGRLLRPGPGPLGHLSVSIGRHNSKQVHQLVMAAFVGPRPEDVDVAHNDGNAKNNNLSNLRYSTRSHNNQDMVYHGKTRLSVGDVHRIRKECKNCVHGFKAALARELKVSSTTIWAVVVGRSYGHVE